MGRPSQRPPLFKDWHCHGKLGGKGFPRMKQVTRQKGGLREERDVQYQSYGFF